MRRRAFWAVGTAHAKALGLGQVSSVYSIAGRIGWGRGRQGRAGGEVREGRW